MAGESGQILSPLFSSLSLRVVACISSPFSAIPCVKPRELSLPQHRTFQTPHLIPLPLVIPHCFCTKGESQCSEKSISIEIVVWICTAYSLNRLHRNQNSLRT